MFVTRKSMLEASRPLAEEIAAELTAEELAAEIADDGEEIEITQTPQYLELRADCERLQERLVELRESLTSRQRLLTVAHETIRQKNEEYAALLTEARPEKSLEVAMLRNRSKEWESLTAENTRLRLQLAADTNGGTK